MPYVSMNKGLPKLYSHIKLTPVIQKKRAQRLAAGQRWEWVRSMYGNVSRIIDHERMIWYRQDMHVHNEGDLFDGYFPFYCDYCQSVVSEIRTITYDLTFEMRSRSGDWNQSTCQVRFAACPCCTILPIPGSLIGYHLTKLHQDGKLLFKQNRKD